MGIVYHESQAWKKYLGTAREKENQKNYLNDFFEGRKYFPPPFSLF